MFPDLFDGKENFLGFHDYYHEEKKGLILALRRISSGNCYLACFLGKEFPELL